MPAPAPLPVVALVGRPNVGKSTLFNRILGAKQAVVHPTPGVTRDRNYGEAEYKRRRFFLIDTGGFEPESQDRMFVQMREQTLLAVEEADAIVFLADVLEPDNPADDEIISILRRSSKPIFLAVNKCDSHRREDEAFSFSRFGFDRVYPLSALHGTGILDLLDDLVEALPDSSESAASAPEATRIAIVGRQNAGKSTLLNRLLGEERVISNPLPGTTRDAIDTYIERDGKLYCLIDTAGIRRRGRIERGIEHLSVVSAVMAIQRCDVVVLVIDADRGIDAQDTHIGGAVAEHWRPCIIALNKWDTLDKDNATYGSFVKKTQEEFKFLPHAKIEAVSALSGQRCHKLWALIDECVEQAAREIPTTDLNRVIQTAVQKVTPPARQGRTLKIKYATQVAVNPPTFVLFVNDPRLIHFSYERYLLNRLRAAFQFHGTPIRLILRRKSPPEGWEQYVKQRDSLRRRPRRKPESPEKPRPKWREEEALYEEIEQSSAPNRDAEEEWEDGIDEGYVEEFIEEELERDSELASEKPAGPAESEAAADAGRKPPRSVPFKRKPRPQAQSKATRPRERSRSAAPAKNKTGKKAPSKGSPSKAKSSSKKNAPKRPAAPRRRSGK